MAREAGTSCTLRALYWEGPVPLAGDFLRTRSGTCYRIDAVEERPLAATIRAVFRVTRLERDAVEDGAPGVWRWEFAPR